MLSDYTVERCRICLEKTESLVSLHKRVAIGEDKILISEILKCCGNIEVLYDDRKPQNACSACIENANVAYKFKLSCMQSEITLNTEILNQNDPLEVKKEDNIIEVNIEEISNIKDEQPNLNNAEVGSEEGEESDDSFNDYDNAEREANSDCFENSDEQDDVEIAGKTKDNQHKCPHCDKSFKYRSYLLNHSCKTICNYCDFKGVGMQKSMHMHIMHYDRKTVQCPHCDSRFFHQIGLKRHMLVHKPVESHVCNVCDQSYTKFIDLIKHRRIHTGRKLYKCDQCENIFLYQAGLSRHKRKHHPNNQSFVCKLCGTVYMQLNELRRHEEMVHPEERPYLCSLCDKRFRNKKSLNVHMKAHMKQFKCDVCSKEFSRKLNLRLHLETHTHKASQHLKISNIKNEERNLNNGKAGSEVSDDSFNDYDNAEQEENNDCFEYGDEQVESNNAIENNVVDIEIATKTKEVEHNCPHCNKSFQSPAFLLRHLRSHDNASAAATTAVVEKKAAAKPKAAKVKKAVSLKSRQH